MNGGPRPAYPSARTPVKSSEPLFLHEEILLLGLRNDAGTPESGIWFREALGGAILAELLLRERIRLVPGKRQELVDMRDRASLGDALLDESLERIATAKRRRPLRHWVTAIGGAGNLRHRVAEGLCRRGILRADEDKVLLIFARKIYPEIDAKPERELVERLRRAVFTATNDVDPRTVVLVSLTWRTGILKAHFGRKEVRRREKRIERIVNGEATGAAAKEALDAAMAAVIVTTCVVPVVVS